MITSRSGRVPSMAPYSSALRPCQRPSSAPWRVAPSTTWVIESMSKPIEQADAQVTPAVAQIQQRNFKEKFQSLCRFCRSTFDDLARAGAPFRSARRLELGKGRVGDARNPG